MSEIDTLRTWLERLWWRPAPGVPSVGAALLLIGAPVLFAWPIYTHPKLPLGMDLFFAMSMNAGMAEGLLDGMLYPRWIDSVNRGFGAPVFIFYSPLAYYASGLATLATHDIVWAFRVVITAMSLLSGVAFYYAFRGLTSEWAASVAAALYVLLPYHVFDFYERFAFAEFAAFVWVPLLFLCARRAVDERSPGAVLGLAATYAALVFTHLITAYLALFVLVPYGLVHVLGRRDAVGLALLAGAGAWALACAAVFLMPVLLERGDVHLHFTLTSSVGTWRDHFVFDATSVMGMPAGNVKRAVNASVASGALIAGVALLLALVRHPWRGRPSEAAREGLVFAGLSAWVIALQFSISSPIWQWVPELEQAQFPWRFGTLQALLACAQVACLGAPPGPRSTEAGDAPADAAAETGAVGVGATLRALRDSDAWAWGVAVLAAIPALVFSSHLPDARDYEVTHKSAMSRHVRSKIFYEYIPKSMEWKPHTTQDLEKAPNVPDPRAFLAGARGRLEVDEWSSHVRRFTVVADRDGMLHVGTFLYPGWQATVDGVDAALTATPIGLMRLPITAGTHQVEIRFVPTPGRVAAAWISGVALAALLAAAAVRGARRVRALVRPAEEDDRALPASAREENRMADLVGRHDEEGIAWLVLNRPDTLNALSPGLFVELREHVDRIAAQTDAVGAVVLRGEGRSFSAGNDLRAIQAGERAPSPHFQAETLEAIEALPQPVIAAVQGHCYTGALELVLACDLLVAAESAKFADTHGRWGMTPTWGMSQRLPRRIGPVRARDLMFTGRVVSGAEALELGLANRCVPDADLVDHTRELAQQIVANSWHTLRADKRLVNEGQRYTLPDALQYERDTSPGAGPDLAERLAEFGKKG